MKKALVMLLTLAMLFSCLVVGVAEEAAYCPPYSLEDCDESWILSDGMLGDGTRYVDTYYEGVSAFYLDGVLVQYSYFNEDRSQCYYFSWNHELNSIGVYIENAVLYTYDGGETWVKFDYITGEESVGELPEDVVLENLPALGAPIKFEMKLVQNIEDVDTRFGAVWDLVDGEGNPAGKMFSTQRMDMYFDNEGKLTEYSYWNEDYSQNVNYTADNELRYINYHTEDGKHYFYWAADNAWSEDIYDEENDSWNVVELEALPEGIEIDVLPPLGEVKSKNVWYLDNTMGVVGLSLRDTFPGLTNKWYNVVPVDLTVDGTTVIPMVASNLFFISNAYVTVDGDNVTVTCDDLPKFGNGWIIDECVAWFTSVDQITTEWLDAPASDLAFGQTISRANDLGDAEIALLFICNHVTYRQPYFDNGAELTRYWPNLTEWKAYRANLTTMLDKMIVVASPDAEMVASPAADDVAE